MTKRIFHSTLAVGLAVLVTSLAVVLGCLYDYYVRLRRASSVTSCPSPPRRWRDRAKHT